MKKVFLSLLLFLTLVSFAFASNELEDKSQVEQVMLQKGTLIIKEFYSCSQSNKVSADVIVLTDVMAGSRIAGLRLSHYYYNSKYDSGTSTGILDSEEIDSVLATLDYLTKKLPTYNSETPYTEIIYKTNGGMQFGAYHSNGTQKFFIKFDSSDTAFFESSVISDFTKFFEDAKSKMISLGVFN